MRYLLMLKNVNKPKSVVYKMRIREKCHTGGQKRSNISGFNAYIYLVH
jgi:hypothetical protein